MRLNHLDLHVPDVGAARDFFYQCFGLEEIASLGRDGLAILRDDGGLELVLSRPIAKLGGADTPTAGANTYHIGFLLPSRAEVDAVYDRVRLHGGEVRMAPASIRGGWLFYCYGPGRILIEVGWRPQG